MKISILCKSRVSLSRSFATKNNRHYVCSYHLVQLFECEHRIECACKQTDAKIKQTKFTYCFRINRIAAFVSYFKRMQVIWLAQIKIYCDSILYCCSTSWASTLWYFALAIQTRISTSAVFVEQCPIYHNS